MQALTTALAQAAETNRSLLTTLAQTDYAQSSYRLNGEYIRDLQTRLAQTELELKGLHAVTNDERKDHLKYRDSTVKRFFYKMGGQKSEARFADKSEKEEREFLDAWQREREKSDFKDELSIALQQAKDDRARLEVEKLHNDQAQNDLDALYQSIFDGPTPDLPHEDQLEDAMRKATDEFHQSQTQLSTEEHAAKFLEKAKVSLDQAQIHMQDAQSYSRWDIYGGGMMADLSERNALSDSQVFVHLTNQHMHEAQRVQSAIRPLSVVDIDQGHVFSDVVFDNLWTDLRQHDRITGSLTQIQQAVHDLHLQISEQSQRVAAAEQAVAQAAGRLESARRALQDTRAEAFDRLAVQNGDAPPGYAV